MSMEYSVMEAPVLEDFYNWYPYIKDENMKGENPLWKKHLNSALLGIQEGMRNIFITAKDAESNKYTGTVWLTFPADYPIMVHFGWFYTEPQYRGMGIGKRIMDICEEWERQNSIAVIMLPTTVKLMAYANIYLKRGWRDTVTDPQNGYTFMVKELQEDVFERYSAGRGTEEYGGIKYKDFIPLDYLINRTEYVSRLYTLDVMGNKRFLSFEQDWDEVDNLVYRRDGMLKGIAVLGKHSGRNMLDVIAYGRQNMNKTLEGALDRFKDRKQLLVVIHENDTAKIEVFNNFGFRETGRNRGYITMNLN